MDPPSKDLLRTLRELRLCTPRDLRRCRPHVRRLARELPTFDSVWLDALVQIGRLTPFQARCLDEGRDGDLRLGPCVLVQPLGGSERSRTCLARHLPTDNECVLKVVRCEPEALDAALHRIRETVRRARSAGNASLVAPFSCLAHDGRLVVISRYVRGPSLSELIVRRGRVPGPVVLALARQLARGLAQLEEAGMVHGDLQLHDVRLQPDGSAVLVDAGVTAAVTPELTIHARTRPERFDGAAPERVGTDRPADAGSDLYGFGCLLWQLLAGRPPFPTGDVLAKLACHQTRRVPDVREIAPETPELLAQAVERLTRREPAARPESFAELSTKIGPPRRGDRARLRSFLQGFRLSAPRLPGRPGRSRPSPLTMAAALLFVLSGLSLTLLEQGARTAVLDVGSRIRSGVLELTARDDEEAPDDAKPTQPLEKDGLLELPPPDADGVIELSREGPYAAARVHTVGALTIRAADGVQPALAVRDEPLLLSADEVLLRGVRFVRDSGDGEDAVDVATPVAVQVRAQRCRLERVRFDGPQAAREGHGAGQRACVEWVVADRSDSSSGALVVHDAVFADGATAVRAHGVRKVDFQNALLLGGGRLLDLGSAPSAGVTLKLERVTLRGSAGLVRTWLPQEGTPGRLWIDAAGCVFDLRPEAGSLFAFTGRPRPLPGELVELAGRDCLLTAGAPVVSFSGEEPPPTEIDEWVLVDGLSASRFTFRGPAGPQPRASELVSFEGPRFSAELPGIVAEGLPGARDR